MGSRHDGAAVTFAGTWPQHPFFTHDVQSSRAQLVHARKAGAFLALPKEQPAHCICIGSFCRACRGL